MSKDTLDTLRDELASCLHELVEAYEAGLRIGDYGPPDAFSEYDRSAIIGFAHPQFTGGLMISTTEGFLATTHDNARVGSDWVGEVANQLLGRLNNRLISFGVKLVVGTPITMKGEKFRAASAGQSSGVIRLKNAAGEIAVQIEIDAAPDLVLSRSATAEIAVAEGETILF